MRGWHDLEVANSSYLVERLGVERGDLQGLRELTVNNLEAIAALGPGAQGRIVWASTGIGLPPPAGSL
ncbi:MAG TPA: hypothetical protein VGI50_10965 [Solirubrobacteraceae bacterium]